MNPQLAGLILCGGESRRMGQDKAALDWNDETLLQAMIEIVSHVCDPVFVVAAAKQSLPELPLGVKVLRDTQPGRGPLAALAQGLEALPDDTTAVFACGCDTPLLKPTVISWLAEHLQDQDAVVPNIEDRWHPLCAVYARRVASRARALVNEGVGPLYKFVESLVVRRISEREFRVIDPNLEALRNLNRRDDYLAARAASDRSSQDGTETG
jgi:molybdopterin-guanine dinucleotide biosynthesis protein A